jgi:hypothetical protein
MRCQPTSPRAMRSTAAPLQVQWARPWTRVSVACLSPIFELWLFTCAACRRLPRQACPPSPRRRPAATNVAQIVISGTRRLTPKGVISMPAFGAAYSDTEIAAVVNYVTVSFGNAPSKITNKEVAELRAETAR